MKSWSFLLLISAIQCCMLVSHSHGNPVTHMEKREALDDTVLDDAVPEGEFILVPQDVPQPNVPNQQSAVENNIVDEVVDDSLPESEDSAVSADLENVNPDDDMMETAENIVFRPLFKYKKQSVERRRVHKDRNGNISNKPTPKPATSDLSPPPLLAYDKKTGSYYPLTSYNPYYSSAYPSYYRSIQSSARAYN